MIIYKGLFIKTCPNVFFNEKGSRTKPPSQGSEMQAIVLCHGLGEKRGYQHQPRAANGEQSCRALHWLCSPSNTAQSASAGAEERHRLVTGG